jgi:hypothetical protein
MFKIRTYNAISDIIYNTLKNDEYQVSDSLENYDGILDRTAEMAEGEVPSE